MAAAAAINPPVCATDGPGRVIPFPGPRPTPMAPPPPPGGGGRDGACYRAYLQCMSAANYETEGMESCRQAYLNCKAGLPTIFPGGEYVP
jgi:hypothetical protein